MHHASSYSRAVPIKRPEAAYLLMLASLVGICGLQHFYLGHPGRGVIWLLTLGLVGIGLLIDLVTMREQVDNANREIAAGTYCFGSGERPGHTPMVA